MNITFGTSKWRTQWLIIKSRRSPWFERQPEATRWLKEQEENRLQGKNIDRPDAKWRLE